MAGMLPYAWLALLAVAGFLGGGCASSRSVEHSLDALEACAKQGRACEQEMNDCVPRHGLQQCSERRWRGLTGQATESRDEPPPEQTACATDSDCTAVSEDPDKPNSGCQVVLNSRFVPAYYAAVRSKRAAKGPRSKIVIVDCASPVATACTRGHCAWKTE
jgi:hypothetical protein